MTSENHYKFQAAYVGYYICVEKYNDEDVNIDIFDDLTGRRWYTEIFLVDEQKIGPIKNHIKNRNYTYTVSDSAESGRFIIGSADNILFETRLYSEPNECVTVDYIKLLKTSFGDAEEIVSDN
jgi:hypothetical protein